MGSSDDQVARDWRERTLAYVRAVNDFVARGRREGWQNVGEPPRDPRGDALAGEVLRRVREANVVGRTHDLRRTLPPAHEPLVRFFDNRARWVRELVWVDDERVLATVGTTAEGPEVHRIHRSGEVAWMPPLVAVGADPTGRFLAFASAYDVEVRPLASALDAEAGALPTFELPPASATDGPFAHRVIPTPDGTQVVVVRDDGVFLCSAGPPRRLFPDDAPTSALAAVHAALSPDGRFVALGARDAQHELVELASGEPVARFGPMHARHAHHAGFSPDGLFAFFNACQHYDGVSVAAPLDTLVGLELPPFEDDPRFVILDAGCRVYASGFCDGRFVLGDAYGYLRQRGVDGSDGWELFCGSSVGAIAFSPDGSRLAVGTAARAVHFFERGEPHPFQIGDGPFAESLRVYFWRDEILRW
ncbi:MAG: hypothetical protein R3B99_16370 [Polyangiales bacterium]